MNVAVKINWRYNAGLSFDDTTPSRVDDKSNDAAATVPTARCFELPKTAYRRGGTKLESTTTKKKIAKSFITFYNFMR